MDWMKVFINQNLAWLLKKERTRKLQQILQKDLKNCRGKELQKK